MSAIDFDRAAAQALAAQAEGRAELVSQLMGLSIEQLASHDPAIWERLDADARERLLSALAGEPVTVASVDEAAPLRQRPTPDRLVIAFWQAASPVIKGFTVAASVWMLCMLMGLATLFVPDPSPFCRRLDEDRQRCIYRVQAPLTWEDAAGRADVGVDTLRRTNPDLVTAIIQPGTDIVIDRSSSLTLSQSFDALVGRHP